MGNPATCYLSPIKAPLLVKIRLASAGTHDWNATITFLVEIESGSYLEFNSMTDCKLYGPKGELRRSDLIKGKC